VLVCTKPGYGFPTPYGLALTLKGLRWYWWKCWPSLFTFSLNKK